MSKSIESQVRMHHSEVAKCFESRNYFTLEEILSSVSAMTAVILNLKIGSEQIEL